MNLLQTIRTIERVAAQQPTIGTIVRNDVFRLNAWPHVRYGAFAWLQGEHRTDPDSSIMTFSFTLFYVDRLTEDKGNEVEVQSVGIETLENVLLALEDLGVFAVSHTFRTFNQRFADECAGAYCTVDFEVAKDTLCPQAWEFLENDGDFNLDYNEDFKCWEWKTAQRTILFY